MMKMKLLVLALLAAIVAADVKQVRLAYAGYNGMNVGWTSSKAPTSIPTVSYGLAPSGLLFKASGTSSTYGTSYFCYVDLNNLEADTVYYYQIDGDTTTRNFRTAPLPGSTKPLSIAVLGDMGLANSANTMKQLHNIVDQTDLYFHVGDISYADDYYLRIGDTYEGSWDNFMNQMEGVTSAKPYMTLPGNHEASCNEVAPIFCPSQQKNFTAYRYRFNMPNKQSGGTQNMWYSFDVGMVHFIAISTETDFPSAPEGPNTYIASGPFGDQLSWLEKDLAAAALNRAAVPWIVIGGHRPIYSSYGGCDSCRTVFEPLFTKYGVDLFIGAHVHWYERLWPISPGGSVEQTSYSNPKMPVYLVNGAAGNIEAHDTGSKKAITDFIYSADYGYARMNVYNATTLEWNFYRATDGVQVDTFTLVKQH